MTGSYALDLEKFSLTKFRAILEEGDLLPSRRILLEQIAERFALLEERGIANLKQLVDALNTPQNMDCFAQESGIPSEYLEILKRQTKIYTPSPQPLKEIPGIPEDAVAKLGKAGIRQTKQLYERAKTRAGRSALAQETGITEATLLELVKLADLARAGWVGPIFARLFYESGADSLARLIEADPQELYDKLNAVNQERGYTKGNFSVKDVASCIKIARELTRDLEE